MVQNQKCVVELHYGSYQGTQVVYCNENDDNEYIIARAFKQADCNFLAMAYKQGYILSRDYIN